MPMCLLMKLGFIKPGLLRFMKSLAYKSCAIGRAVKNHPPEANLDAWLIHLEFWRREQTRLVIKDGAGSFSDESGASSWYQAITCSWAYLQVLQRKSWRRSIA